MQAHFPDLVYIISFFQHGADKISHDLKHVKGITQILLWGIIYAVKSHNCIIAIKRNDDDGMDILPFQVFVLQRITLPHFLYVIKQDIFVTAKIAVPVFTDFRRQILEVILFGRHTRCNPFVGIIIPAGWVLFKNISPFPFQGFPKKFKYDTD